MSGPSVTTLTLPRPVESSPDLPRIIASVAVSVTAFDSCFWGLNDVPGLSVAVFFAVLALMILFNRPRRNVTGTGRILLSLLAGSLLAAVIEPGFCVTLVLWLLIVATAGETFFTDIPSLPGRWTSQVLALIGAPARAIWLLLAMTEKAVEPGSGFLGPLAIGAVILVPTTILLLVFGALFAAGNAVFGAWTHDFFTWIWREVAFDLDPWRLLLWGLVASFTLPLLCPARFSAGWWSWMERLPRLPDILPHRVASLASGLVLVSLNLLFLIANIADALFLWSGQKLPVGVNYSDFVHQGVATLIFTVLLSTVVLTSIFQQAPGIARRRGLKILGNVWIAQNVFLLLSVGERLRSYMQAYDMTVSRLGVLIFLVLVAVGFGLLAVKIARDKSLSWLLGGALLAAFGALYLTPFLNLGGWTAEYNVRQWEKDHSRSLDVEYLHELGPAAWPALRRAEREGATTSWDMDNAHEGGLSLSESERLHPHAELNLEHWREFSLRAWLNCSALEDDRK